MTQKSTLHNLILQVMEEAKQKGQQELLGRRENLLLELEKVSRRIAEFAECSELDMVQQVHLKILLIICPVKKHSIKNNFLLYLLSCDSF